MNSPYHAINLILDMKNLLQKRWASFLRWVESLECEISHTHGLLNKREAFWVCVYGPRCCWGLHYINTKISIKPTSSHLDWTSSVNKGFITWHQENHFCSGHSRQISKEGKITQSCLLRQPYTVLTEYASPGQLADLVLW